MGKTWPPALGQKNLGDWPRALKIQKTFRFNNLLLAIPSITGLGTAVQHCFKDLLGHGRSTRVIWKDRARKKIVMTTSPKLLLEVFRSLRESTLKLKLRLCCYSSSWCAISTLFAHHYWEGTHDPVLEVCQGASERPG